MQPPARSLRVTRDYRPQYSDPIRARAADRVQLGHSDPEFPGWLWCIAADGRQGWVPEELLQRHSDGHALLSRDYSALELAVNAGDEVECLEERHAWLRVRNSAGQAGWVPASHTCPR